MKAPFSILDRETTRRREESWFGGEVEQEWVSGRRGRTAELPD